MIIYLLFIYSFRHIYVVTFYYKKCMTSTTIEYHLVFSFSADAAHFPFYKLPKIFFKY